MSLESQIEVREVGALSAMSREQAEIQAAIVTARKFPRSESAAVERAMRSFERRSMAESAAYKFPRGGSTITGPSVDCARELARCWGNVRYGLSVVSMDEEYVHVQGWAYDVEMNIKTVAEDKFKMRIQRKRNAATIWVDPDERELRELINRRGAICVRNAILQILPPDLIEDALRQAHLTLVSGAKDSLARSRDDVVRDIVLAFSRIGIGHDLIERRLGHPMTQIDEHELADLRAIYASLRDGQARREDYFEADPAPVESLKDRVRRNSGRDRVVAGPTEAVNSDEEEGEHE